MKGTKRLYAWSAFVLAVLAGYALLLFILEASGYIVFVNRVTALQEYMHYLGTSIYFFVANLMLFGMGCMLLARALSVDPVDSNDVYFWNSVVNLSVTLFFGIGVIYTAVGMQRAFQLALGSIDQSSASALGPWGILSRLVEGGLIMALFTTIIGGSLGYLLRFLKFMLFGRALIRLEEEERRRDQAEIVDALKSIDSKLSCRMSGVTE